MDASKFFSSYNSSPTPTDSNSSFLIQPWFILLIFGFLLFAAIVNSIWFWGNVYTEHDGIHDHLNVSQYDWNYLFLIWFGLLMIFIGLFIAYLTRGNPTVVNFMFYGGLTIILVGILYHLTTGKYHDRHFPDKKIQL